VILYRRASEVMDFGFSGNPYFRKDFLTPAGFVFRLGGGGCERDGGEF
jgi:hypothetical protein